MIGYPCFTEFANFALQITAVDQLRSIDIRSSADINLQFDGENDHNSLN